MQWLILPFGLLGAGLLLVNAVAVVRRRARLVGPSPWAWLVVLSRALLVLPFAPLAVTGGRWPAFPWLTVWFGGCALLILVADLADRLALLRRLKATRGQGAP
ncbi:MAG TPA: hypothetical protein GXX28_01935 [Firmicutes bacterium]|nr:hypothetical protein [Bacillota bacterium]